MFVISSVKWGEFKKIGVDEFHIFSLEYLYFENEMIVSGMMIVEKMKIARIIAINGLWKHFIDYYVEDEERNKYYKTLISNPHPADGTKTKKLIDLIIQMRPGYTMKQFFTVCKECYYNDTLHDLENICSTYSIYMQAKQLQSR